MQIPKDAVIAVVDGEKLHLFQNSDDHGQVTLAALPAAALEGEKKGSGGRHESGSANHDHDRLGEDGFALSVANMLNRRVLDGKIDHLVIVAAPHTLGELRRHYHKALAAVLVGEIAKDLTGHTTRDVESAIERN